MKRFFPVALALAVFVPFTAFADDIETDSAIRAATVYTNRAKLTREAVVEIPAGAHTVIFKDLPAGILPDSLRIEGKAAAYVKFGALSHKQTAQKELAAPREKELNAQLETLGDQRKAVQAEKNALVAQKSFLESIGRQAVLRENEEIAALNLKPEQWTAAAESIRAGMADILAKDLALDVKLRDLDKQIRKVQTDLSQLYTGQKTTFEVSVPLEASAATNLTLDLSYQVMNATWTPLYDARLDTETSKLELVQYGAVRQQTGEDWSKVSLTLSTAQPQRGAGVPDLQPWWVNLWTPQPLAPAMAKSFASRSMSGGVAEMAMDAAAPMAQTAMYDNAVEEKEAVFQQAEIETGGFVSEYKIAGPATVPADGTETKLMVGAFDTKSELQIQVKPQMGTDAYLVAQTKLMGDAPILPGQVNLFRDGAYVGQSLLPLLRLGEEQDLSFGIDDQVSVTRRMVMDERSEAGVISKDNVQERHFITAIQNLHSRPLTIAVMETVPVAQDEKIKVDIVRNATTEGYEKDKDNVKGMLEWSVPLSAKEKKEVKLGWKVSWPKDFQITGF